MSLSLNNGQSLTCLFTRTQEWFYPDKIKYVHHEKTCNKRIQGELMEHMTQHQANGVANIELLRNSTRKILFTSQCTPRKSNETWFLAQFTTPRSFLGGRPEVA